jgi:hypothetical protein
MEKFNTDAVNGGKLSDSQEHGITYGGKLVRDMTDEEIATNLRRAQQEHHVAQGIMQAAVMKHAVIMAIANVLDHEHYRRTHTVRLPGDFK